MSLLFTDKQARQVIASKIQTASGSSRVYSFNALAFKVDPKTGRADFSDWIANMSYTASGVDYIHGWIIRRISRMSELRNTCEDVFFTYEILGVYQFSSGGTETANSDDTFGTIIDNICAEFNQDGGGTLTINNNLALHDGIQFPDLTVIQSGEKFLHFAKGYLELRQTT